MKESYTVKELAELCSVSEQAIRAYLARNDCAKVASQWKPTQDELRKLFKHYGVEVAELAQESQDSCASNKNSTTPFAQTTQATQAQETAGQKLNQELSETLRILREQIEKKDKQIEWLQSQMDAQNETIKALTATKAMDTFVENKDALLVEPIPNGESLSAIHQEKKEESANAADAKPAMTNEQWQEMSRWERIKQAWNGVFLNER